MERVLDQAESLVTMTEQLDKPVRVELIAYGQGLSLIKSNRLTYAERILHLHRRHDNLMFIACQDSLDKQQKKTIDTIRVLPGVVIVPSGPEEVSLRRSQGWTIVKV